VPGVSAEMGPSDTGVGTSETRSGARTGRAGGASCSTKPEAHGLSSGASGVGGVEGWEAEMRGVPSVADEGVPGWGEGDMVEAARVSRCLVCGAPLQVQPALGPGRDEVWVCGGGCGTRGTTSVAREPLADPDPKA